MNGSVVSFYVTKKCCGTENDHSMFSYLKSDNVRFGFLAEMINI